MVAIGVSSSSTSSYSNVDGEHNSESDEYNCERDFVGCSTNTNTSSNSKILDEFASSDKNRRILLL